LFTYANDANETDIEILTRDPTTLIRYTNQPGVGPDGNDVAVSETDQNLPNDFVWSDYHTHQIDWSPELTEWSIDGISVVNKSYSVPTLSSTIDINAWSDGGVWSGNMSVGSAAYLDLLWVEMIFNTADGPLSTDLEKAGSCKTTCTIDDVQTIGQPELYSAASRLSLDRVYLMSAFVACIVGMINIWY
jgi:beta-glucanase (GH16 family)